jgi:hypothetical protein
VRCCCTAPAQGPSLLRSLCGCSPSCTSVRYTLQHKRKSLTLALRPWCCATKPEQVPWLPRRPSCACSSCASVSELQNETHFTNVSTVRVGSLASNRRSASWSSVDMEGKPVSKRGCAAAATARHGEVPLRQAEVLVCSVCLPLPSVSCGLQESERSCGAKCPPAIAPLPFRCLVCRLLLYLTVLLLTPVCALCRGTGGICNRSAMTASIFASR